MEHLWAPWRLEYMKSADNQDECLFCTAAANPHDPARLVVHVGGHAVALLNKFPYASGHFMVAPVRHVGDYEELTDEEVLELHRFASAGIGGLAELYAPQGYNLGWNLGPIAGAMILPVHLEETRQKLRAACPS